MLIGMSEVSTICKCGRAYTHCKNDGCGSRNVYVKKFRSFEQSDVIGKRITVYGCRRCQRETVSEQECMAPSREFDSSYRVYQKPVELPPWGNLIPGSDEYAQSMNEWVSECSQKKRLTVNKAFVEAKRQGWQPELYSMEDDLREELELAGLLETKSEEIAQEPPSSPVKAEQGEQREPIPLEDIIKQMQEDSK